jgi:hypothetical protein
VTAELASVLFFAAGISGLLSLKIGRRKIMIFGEFCCSLILLSMGITTAI